MGSAYCEFCGSDRLFLTKGTVQRRVNGSRLEISDVDFLKCEFCGEKVLLPYQEEAIRKRVDAEIRKNKGLLTPEEIRGIRNSLNLTQIQLAKVIGCGKASLSRWEKGGLQQSRLVDNFLRVLKTHPEIVVGAESLPRR
ncbi:MAG: type II toxin-antitoxin system MqsA family antitoxin [Deltaproteobacteria bacterium]|nr:type II toxin-antitoxin system MqsA family antitoxin [Deltaproteobacteria bacterium]